MAVPPVCGEEERENQAARSKGLVRWALLTPAHSAAHCCVCEGVVACVSCIKNISA